MSQGVTVYLAGLIDTDHPESLEWRRRAAAVLSTFGFHVLDPMRGKDDLFQTTKDGGLTHGRLAAKDIILRDRGDVAQSDIILVNLNTFGSSRPLVGTIYELAWAWDGKTRVVAIAAEDNYFMRNHPFIKETVSAYCTSEDEAYEYIKRQA